MKCNSSSGESGRFVIPDARSRMITQQCVLRQRRYYTLKNKNKTYMHIRTQSVCNRVPTQNAADDQLLCDCDLLPAIAPPRFLR